MSDDLVKVTVSEGKYTFGQRKDGSCYALRYGEPWREDIFDGLTLAMAHHIEVLEAAFSNLSREYDKRADRIEELEAENRLLQDAVYIGDLTVNLMANDRITHHAKRWLNDKLPADLIASLADILEDENYLPEPEQRAHQVVWQALKWMMENPVPKKGEKP